MQDIRPKTQDPRHKTKDLRFKWSGVWGQGSGVGGRVSGVWSLGSAGLRFFEFFLTFLSNKCYIYYLRICLMFLRNKFCRYQPITLLRVI